MTSSNDPAGQRPKRLVPARELLNFAGTLPLWQQHLIGCLFNAGEATQDDAEAGYRLLLADHGLLDGDPPTSRPLSEADVPPEIIADSLVLQGIGPTSNVNRLAPDQVLPFATNGLTIVYGENGSGKSGFVRILKAVCRARGPGEQVLPDVITSTGAAVPTAKIRFRASDGDHEVAWREGDEGPDSLGTVSIFDADRAPIYSDSERRLEFLPAGLHVLGQLGEVMNAYAARLDAEAAQLRQAVPVLAVAPVATRAGRLAGRIAEGQALPGNDELIATAAWTSEDDVRLSEMQGTLLLDPAKAEVRADRLATALTNIAVRVRELDAALGDVALGGIREARTTALEARRASDVLAEDLTQRVSRLPHVGSDPWRRMFSYAKEYALLAYGSSELPPGKADDPCPLCQQVLSSEAHDRFVHFSAFVEGHAEQEAQARELELSTRVAKIGELSVPTRLDVETVMTALEPVLPDALPALERAATTFDTARSRQAALVALSEGAVPDTEWPDDVSERLDEYAGVLTALAATHREMSGEGRRAALQLAVDELVAGRSLAHQLDAASSRLELLGRLRTLATARRACDTATVSRKNSELRTGFLTSDFDRRLKGELAGLGLDQIPLKLVARSQAGHSLVSVVIDTHWSIRNRQILSEGELRALAIACFFAEVQTIPGLPPLVLDDPVSSLDHVRIERVAQRVIAEARKGRQTIVFTHSLVFFHELWVQASESQVPTATHWLTLALGEPGYVRAQEQPWDVQDVKTRLNELERRLAAAKRIGDRASDEYRAAVTHFYTGMRETWERLVEEQLLGNVVQRFRLGVETKSLRVVEVTDDDYAKVYFAMTRASEFSGHDRAIARQLAAPTPDDMSKDLKELRAYHNELKTRGPRLDRRRRLRHAPPTGQLELGAS